ncbi:MAG TPA: outer membrane beta-barrel protein [Pseudolabrys sp.]|nr:outer membrane beta-barrel protein [Pseudolabrys sp.]
MSSHMRRIGFFLLALAAFNLGAVDGAFSADLGRSVYAPSSPLPVYAPPSWTTCYVGLNAGGVWSSFGFTGGGQVGCNWQGNYRLVWGGEADVQYTGLDDSRDVFAPGASAHQDFRSRWLATFRGRFGWLAAENMYFYATGGLALANVDTDSTVNFNGIVNNVSDSTTHAGWTLGAGLEWRFLPLWSAKVEYLYVDLGHATNVLPISNNDHSLTENIVRIGVNYHFW